MTSASTELPDLFEGLRVVEIGQYVAAPYCAELFADGGAEVISIEPPAGTPTRFSPPGAPDGIQFLSKSRGKRSVAVALSSPEGASLVRSICLGADVVICNLRPGLADRLGLGYEQLAAEAPGIIVAEVDGFGELSGDRGCVDIVAQAASGLLASLALGGQPIVRRDVLLTDVAAGMLLAFGVASALWVRERTGRGQRVATSLIAGALALQVRTAHIVGDGDPALMDLAADAASASADFGDVLERRTALTNKMYATYDVFATATGWVAVGAARSTAHRLLEIAGLPGDTDLRDPSLAAQLHAALATVDADELVAQLDAAGVPAARMRLLEDVMLDDTFVAAGFVAEAEHARVGRVRLPAAPLRFSGGQYRTRDTFPDLGADTAAVLRDLGVSASAIDELARAGVIANGAEVST